MIKREACPNCNCKLQSNLCQNNNCSVKYFQYCDDNNLIYEYSFYTKIFKVYASIQKQNIDVAKRIDYSCRLNIPYFDIDFSKLNDYDERWNKLFLFS